MLRRVFTQSWIILCLAAVAAHAEDGSITPVRVCDVLRDVGAYEGKVVAIVGRYSFRSNGRFLSEESCEEAQASDGHRPQVLHIAFDGKLAPKTPDRLQIDSGLVQRLLKTIQKQTSLAKFRFGTPDYDRWAVVYGRVEPAPGKSTGIQLICIGDSVIMFIVDRY
jgi:hypothetical protein